MSKKNKKYKRKNNKNVFGIFLMFIVFAIIISLIAYYRHQSSSNKKINQSTYCPVDGNSSITVILIDGTDKLNPIQQASLRNELQKVRDEIPKNGKLEIYLVNNTKEHVLKPILNICNPGRGAEANEYYQNPKLIERKWEENFNQPLTKILLSLSEIRESKESPIFESIQSIAVSTFNHPDNQYAQQRRLIIASDMLQHTNQFDLYHKKYEFPQEKDIHNFKKVLADLRNVDIDILLFQQMSNKNTQGKQFIKFWNDYFNHQHATINRIYAITG
jgi:hypothetical protein